MATAINNSAIYNDLKRTKIELHESQQIIRLTNVFEKFVPKEFLERLGPGGNEGIKIGSAMKVSISILFTDIRAFTSISESMEANKLLSFINDYFNSMQIEIYKNKGFIDKFIGDAIMALFEENESDDISNASHALDSAINMHWALDKFNNENPVALENPLKIGTAIHTGDVILGTVGSENRINTTVLGDNVNLAARLEKMTKLYGSKILITQNTYDALTHKEKYLIRPLGRTLVRGRKEPITIFEVFNCDDTDIVKLKIQTMGILQNALELLGKNQTELAQLEFNKILEINPDDAAIKCILNFIPRFTKLA